MSFYFEHKEKYKLKVCVFRSLKYHWISAEVNTADTDLTVSVDITDILVVKY